MKLISIQEAYTRKFQRQREIKELEYHAAGHCVHIGKLSPGCCSCFYPDPSRMNFIIGSHCNADCPYCTYKMETEPDKEERLKRMAGYFRNSRLPEFNPSSISFTGGGEPLLYMDTIRDCMKFFRDIDKQTGKITWYYLYTNGLIANPDILSELKELGFNEIRFHLGASGFAQEVYRNIEKAVDFFKAVTVETPAWPPYRDKLFKMLPVINDIGVKHLNIGELEITKDNFSKISQALPDAEMYQCHDMHLYDGGLVYDIIEEVLRRGFSYSVLDCNCFVKSIQRSPAKQIAHEDIKGLCAEY